MSPVYEVDRKYKSMAGPQSTQGVRLVESRTPKLLWITGYKAVIVDAKGEKQGSQEFMCHSNQVMGSVRHQGP